MFLNLLNEHTKKGFLKLCVHAYLSNGAFAEKEKDILFAYYREMNIYILEVLDLIKYNNLLDKYSKIGKELYVAITEQFDNKYGGNLIEF